ncbi:hypothetical protein [Histidinibacterium lentulum]|uniref:hypothetical protein n=1 Tax=Histidinibacterium lentulum TaxID=2480588 RepID=UPI0011CD9EF7|nr:hypothetical protein [Histidinibacterium lentulum]
MARIESTGLFANTAQSGFGARPARIDAGISTLMDGLPPASLSPVTIARPPAHLILGTMESVALGATNAGEVILSVAVDAGLSVEPAGLGSLGGVPASSVVLYGEDMAMTSALDSVRIEDLIAASSRAATDVWQTGTTPDAPVGLMNLAANAGDVNARILTRVNAAVLDAQDMTATALGAVNVGLARIVGER